jgi:hypothetical protein
MEPSSLPDGILAKINPEHFQRLHEIAMKAEGWDDLGKTQAGATDQAFIMAKFFKNNIAYDKWEIIPETVKRQIPKQKWIRYFQHRTTDRIMESALNDDVWDVLMGYINTAVRDGVMTDYFLPKARAISNLYTAAGQGETLSVRGYMDEYIRSVAGFNKQGSAVKMLNDLLGSISAWFGKPAPSGAYMVEEAANMYQGWLYRGALGIDTAVRNLTQSLYTVAELGPYNWVKGLRGYVVGGLKQTPEYRRFRQRQTLIDEFYTTKMDMFKKGDPTKYERWRDLDQKVTSLALLPMRVTEHINRGIAYFAGLAEAASQGLPFEQGHIVGINRATLFTHPLEMSESEWFATQKMYSTQFGYGRVHTSPTMQGPLMRFLTPFWSFPIKSLQFVNNLGKSALKVERWREVPAGVQKEGPAFLLSNEGRMARFLALTGFMTMAPAILAATLGVDAGYLWGKGLFPNNFTPMWMEMMENIHVGIFGGVGMSVPPTAKDKEQAFKKLSNALFLISIPQYRFGAKVDKAVGNMEKGYYAMGPAELPATETTFAKELVNMLGFPPYTREGKQLIYEAYRVGSDDAFVKQNAIRRAAEYWEKGKYDKAASIITEASKKLPEAISQLDIIEYLRRQETETAYAEVQKHIPTGRRAEWGPKLQAAEQKFLPGGAAKRRQRDFWTNNVATREEEIETEISPYELPIIEESEGLSGLIEGTY